MAITRSSSAYARLCTYITMIECCAESFQTLTDFITYLLALSHYVNCSQIAQKPFICYLTLKSFYTPNTNRLFYRQLILTTRYRPRFPICSFLRDKRYPVCSIQYPGQHVCSWWSVRWNNLTSVFIILVRKWHLWRSSKSFACRRILCSVLWVRQQCLLFSNNYFKSGFYVR